MSDQLIKIMFGTSQWPIIDFDLSSVSLHAQQLTGKLSISGVQPKLIMTLNKGKNHLEAAAGGEYILKPQTDRFLSIPENEQCCMDIAEAFNIETPPHCLLALKDGSLAYVIKRFDREHGEKIHQEEFSQLLEIDDKYKGSVEQIGRKIKEVSTAPGYDLQLFFERVLLNFILANADAHLKNYAMRYKDNDKRLSPAYDIICSRLAIPDEKEESALSINGKKNDLKRKDFDKLAGHLKTPADLRYNKFINKFSIMMNIIENSKLTKENKVKFSNIIKERLVQLELLT